MQIHLIAPIEVGHIAVAGRMTAPLLFLDARVEFKVLTTWWFRLEFPVTAGT
jgi:hypothetical protein